MCAWQGPQYSSQNQQPWQRPIHGGSSWQDPRFANQTSYQTNLSNAQGPVSPVQSYNVPSAPAVSNWGVNLNNSQPSGYPAGSKPPLPPRPGSSLAHNPSSSPYTDVPSWQTPAWPAPTQHAPAWPAPAQDAQFGRIPDVGHGAGHQWAQGSLSTEQQGGPPQHQLSQQSPVTQPPLPPPRPSAYQAQSQYDQSHFDQHKYSHYSGSQHYDPNTQSQSYAYEPPRQETHQNPVPQSSTYYPQNTQAEQRPPVSPEDAHAMPWASTSQMQTLSQHSGIESGSSALGVGGPSDWEHFQGPADSVDEGERMDAINTAVKPENSSSNDQYAELPANLSPITSKGAALTQGPLPHAEITIPTKIVGEVPLRDQSVSPEPSSEGLRRTATIDGLIQEWSTPLNRGNVPGGSRKSSVSTVDHLRRDADTVVRSSPGQTFHSPSIKKHRDNIRTSEHDSFMQSDPARSASPSRKSTRQNSLTPATILTKTVEVDPYADLGPEYRASLARYATMLRKEEAASEEEKYPIFKAFVLKENRLRCILYNVSSDESELSLASQDRMAKTKHKVDVAEAMPHRANASSLQPAKELATAAPDSSRELPGKLAIETTPTSNEESYVVVERDGESEYSPGGRPRMARSAPRRTASHPPPKSAPKQTHSPSDYAPMVVDEIPQSSDNQASALVRDPLQRPGTAPLSLQNSITSGSFKFEPSRPAYTPFRYAENSQRDIEASASARPAYQAYSALRHQSEDSGRVMTHSATTIAGPPPLETSLSPTGNNARREHEEAFLGLIREKSRAYRVGKKVKTPTTLANDQMPPPEIVDHGTHAINALRALIPSTFSLQLQQIDSANILGIQLA